MSHNHTRQADQWATLYRAYRTRQYGFITAVAARSILSGAALPTHDAVILGAEGLLSQRLVTLCTAETLLVPVSALVAELLMEENGEFLFFSFG